MTEKELLRQQETNGQKALYLIAVGMFYHTYGCGAFALARATAYRVLRKHRKGGDILVCGFPASQLDAVLQRIREAGGEVEAVGEKTFLFRGLDGTTDEKLIAEPKKAPTPNPSTARRGEFGGDSLDSSRRRGADWLADELLSFNLSLSTPMDAMNLIARLQRRLREEQEQKRQEEPRGHPTAEMKLIDIACESPAGQGLQE